MSLLSFFHFHFLSPSCVNEYVCSVTKTRKWLPQRRKWRKRKIKYRFDYFEEISSSSSCRRLACVLLLLFALQTSATMAVVPCKLHIASVLAVAVEALLSLNMIRVAKMMCAAKMNYESVNLEGSTDGEPAKTCNSSSSNGSRISITSLEKQQRWNNRTEEERTVRIVPVLPSCLPWVFLPLKEQKWKKFNRYQNNAATQLRIHTHTLLQQLGKKLGQCAFQFKFALRHTNTHLTHADTDHISRLLCTTHTRQVSFYSKWLLSDQNVTRRKGKRKRDKARPANKSRMKM